MEGSNHVVFYGLQAFLNELTQDFQEMFFDRDVEEVVAEYRHGIDGYVDLEVFDDSHIRKLHALGYLPLEIRAVREGTPVPVRVPSLTIENTHSDFPWLVNYLVVNCDLAPFHQRYHCLASSPSTGFTCSYDLRPD